MRERITDKLVEKTKPPTKGQLLIWDDLVQGFGCRITPTMRSFVVQYSSADGRKPRESLRPRYPQLKADAARELARKRLSQVVVNSTEQAARPLREAMRAWYERNATMGSWRPRYRQKVDYLVRAYVEGEGNNRIRLTPNALAAIEQLGRKAVGSVTNTDVMRVVDEIKRGAADQFMAIGSAFYNFAADRGVQCLNPFRNRLRILGGRRVRSRSLNDAELLSIWRALEADGDPASTCFAVLAFTGCRRREATGMRWAELDFEAGTWTLPPERRKTGSRDPNPFVINLHPALLTMLRKQPALEASPYVFWGRRDKRPWDFHYATMQRLRALDLPEWRLHDVRRAVRSGMARLGVHQAVAEQCLGHVVGGSLVRVYDAYSYKDEKRDAWQRWGDHIVNLTAIEAAQ